MTERVFISYALDDKPFADRVARSLGDHGVRVLFDPSSLAAGSNWHVHLRKALEDTDSVVVVLSEAAVNSGAVLFELGAAQALGKRILPIAAPNQEVPTALPPVLSSIQVLRSEGLSENELAASIQRGLAS